jgi:serine/threonine protein kinase/histone H3/H4
MARTKKYSLRHAPLRRLVLELASTQQINRVSKEAVKVIGVVVVQQLFGRLVLSQKLAQRANRRTVNQIDYRLAKELMQPFNVREEVERPLSRKRKVTRMLKRSQAKRPRLGRPDPLNNTGRTPDWMDEVIEAGTAATVARMETLDDYPKMNSGHLESAYGKRIRELGRGTFGVVYLYHKQSPTQNTYYAIKFSSINHPKIVERMIEEVGVITRLNNPHVVKYYSLIAYESTRTKTIVPTIVMQAVGYLSTPAKGFICPTMADWNMPGAQHAMEPLPYEILKDAALQLFGALDYLHRKGVVHRDIKPGNIFITENARHQPTFVLGDFGLACLRDNDDLVRLGAQPSGCSGKACNISSRKGLICDKRYGTEAFLSPEWYIEGILKLGDWEQNVQRYLKQADVYAMTLCLFFRALTHTKHINEKGDNLIYVKLNQLRNTAIENQRPEIFYAFIGETVSKSRYTDFERRKLLELLKEGLDFNPKTRLSAAAMVEFVRKEI